MKKQESIKGFWVLFISAIILTSCIGHIKPKDYRVSKKDSGNFSIMAPELQPKERMIVKINDDVIWDVKGRESKNFESWQYYNYPNKIRVVQFIDYYKGVQKIKKVFNDTLLDAKQRTLIITRTFPKNITDIKFRKPGYVSIDTATRSVTLENDVTAFKGTWTY